MAPGDCFPVSLNRYEHALFEYLREHPEELRHWQAKVSERAARGALPPVELAGLLQDYVRERATQVEPFRSWALKDGLPRSSLLNLSEYLLRIWGPPVAAKAKPAPRP